MTLAITPEAAAITLATNVKNQINAAVMSKENTTKVMANAPARKANLESLLAREDVQDALGSELADAQAAIAAL